MTEPRSSTIMEMATSFLGVLLRAWGEDERPHEDRRDMSSSRQSNRIESRHQSDAER